MSKVGIVGFGIVGKSVLSFLTKHRCDERMALLGLPSHFTCHVWDSRLLDDAEREIIQEQGACVVQASEQSLEQFFHSCDIIIPSPGVNINAFLQFRNKILCELDFFSIFFKKPLVAVTGTLGKTTTTKLIGELLPLACKERFAPLICSQDSQQCTVAVGGNIGTAMLDLATEDDKCACAVLELSSWQLELSNRCAPDIAVWTNLFPNHLDRHQTMHNYFDAKFALFAHQREASTAIIAADILQGDIRELFYEKLPQLKSTVVVTSLRDENLEKLLEYQPNVKLIFVDQGWVVLREYATQQCHKIMPVDDLSSITFVQNWLQVIATLCAAGMPSAFVRTFLRQHGDLIEGLSNHHHRVEFFTSINDVDFYDDSKSTVVQATQAAVQKLAASNRPLILILGGLSKGVDRSVLADFLKQQPTIKKIYCFGKDCADFSSFNYFETLGEIVADLTISAVAGDIVLFSPSGASFDLFKDYKHRGKIFQELVLQSMPAVQ